MKKKVISLIMAVILSMGMFMLVGCNDAEKKLQKQIDELNALLTEQAGKITELESSKTEQENKIAELESSKTEQAGKIEELQNKNTEQANKIEELATENSALRETMDYVEKHIKMQNAKIISLNSTESFEAARLEYNISDDTMKNIAYYHHGAYIYDGEQGNINDFNAKPLRTLREVEIEILKEVLYNLYCEDFPYAIDMDLEEFLREIEFNFCGEYDGLYVVYIKYTWLPVADVIIEYCVDNIQFVRTGKESLYGIYF